MRYGFEDADAVLEDFTAVVRALAGTAHKHLRGCRIAHENVSMPAMSAPGVLRDGDWSCCPAAATTVGALHEPA